MMLRAALSLLVVLCLAGLGVAEVAFPALTGRVVDDAGLLSPAQRADLSASLAALERQTSDQLVVVTLKSLQGTTIEDYGYQLGRHWGIGQKDRDSGALLIVAPAERKVRIEVGYGLEGTLTDAAIKVVIERSILPRFKTGDVAGGVQQGAANLIQLLEGDAAAATDAPRPTPAVAAAVDATGDADTPGWPVIALGLGAVALLIVCAITGGALCRGVTQILLLMALSGGRGGGGGGSGGRSSFSGGGGSFGGGGSSGSW